MSGAARKLPYCKLYIHLRVFYLIGNFKEISLLNKKREVMAFTFTSLFFIK
jgi:hypothetical protein